MHARKHTNFICYEKGYNIPSYQGIVHFGIDEDGQMKHLVALRYPIVKDYYTKTLIHISRTKVQHRLVDEIVDTINCKEQSMTSIR